MHDSLAHRLSLLSLHAGALEFRPGAPADEIASSAAMVRSNAHRALEDLREVIGVLREATTDRQAGGPRRSLADLAALVQECGCRDHHRGPQSKTGRPSAALRHPGQRYEPRTARLAAMAGPDGSEPAVRKGRATRPARPGGPAGAATAEPDAVSA